jgi:hypothetical protein
VLQTIKEGSTVTIKAIETTYGGCRFRSRLEARWAVLLDHLKIEWQYEAQGYEFNGRHYLPDFYLPLSKVHLEVKGGDDALHAEIGRLQEFVVAADTEFTCGSALDACRCQYLGPVALSPAAMELRHEAAVKRAKRSDKKWGRNVETQRRAA